MIFPYCPDCPNSPKTANPCFISCYVYDTHNINLAVLIFFKTYVCKHKSKRERKHIELKPMQKKWPTVTLTLWCQHLVCCITTSWILLRFLSFPINTINSTTPPGLVGVHLPNNQQQLHMQELKTPCGSLNSCFLIDTCFMQINR